MERALRHATAREVEEAFPARWLLFDLKYSEDQPRDDHGRFGSGGGGESGGTSHGDLGPPERTTQRQSVSAVNKLDKTFDEKGKSAAEYKDQVANDLRDRLADNPAWQEYVQTGGHNAMAAISLRHADDPSGEMVSNLMQSWAGTSGDSDYKAVALQMAVQKEFGLDNAATSHLSAGDAATRDFGRNGDAYQAFAREMYNNTQDQLKDAGVTSVTAYRGMAFDNADAARAVGFQPDATVHTITTDQQPASSWSYDPEVARAFASGTGAVVAAQIPADRILSTARTGFGAKGEKEMVVLGGQDQVNSVMSRPMGHISNATGPELAAMLGKPDGTRLTAERVVHLDADIAHADWIKHVPPRADAEEKFNPYHGEGGRFASSDSASFVSLWGKPSEAGQVVGRSDGGSSGAAEAGGSHPSGKLDVPTPQTESEVVETGYNLYEKINDVSQTPEEYKEMVTNNLMARLEDNPDFKAYVDSGEYHTPLNWSGSYRPDTPHEAAVAGLLQQWAGSSGDHEPGAVAMQMAIQKEFGMNTAATGHLTTTDPETVKDFASNGAAYQAFAREMYNNTQEELKAQGIESMTLYRGLMWNNTEEARASGMQITDVMVSAPQVITQEVAQQPASSWTFDPSIASSFTQTRVGTVMATQVPAERVLSTIKTGFGAKDESEVVVLGSGSDTVNQWTGAGGQFDKSEAFQMASMLSHPGQTAQF